MARFSRFAARNDSEQINPKFAERLTPETAALALLDHQTGISMGVGDMSPDSFQNNALAIAKIGKIFDLPIVLSTSYDDGPNEPFLPAIREVHKDARFIHRPGEINGWDNPDFRKAVEAIGRKKIILAGVTTDVCLLFPAIAMAAEGYDVYAVIDASGTWNQTVQMTSALRMTQAGVKTTNWVSVSAELLKDWRDARGPQVAQLYHDHLKFYGSLMENFGAASKAAGKN